MYCKKCGNELSGQARFCGKCGENIVGDGKYPSPKGTRFLNFILDTVIGGMCSTFLLVTIWGLASFLKNAGAVASDNLFVTSINLLLPILVGISLCGIPNPIYYILFESIWQKTPAKWITKTKVTNLDGTKPQFWTIVGRSFARLIPLEHLTFLMGRYPFGWHDSLSHTVVVPVSYSTEDIKSIDIQNHGESKFAKAVTIVVSTLVAIYLIGIFSSVVLASLNTARQKAVDAQYPEGWTTYNAVSDGFSILAPHTPSFESNTDVTDEGISYEYRGYSAEKGSTQFLIAKYVYSEPMDFSNTDNALEVFLNGFISGSESKLLSSSYSYYKTYRVLDFTSKTSSEFIKGRLILVEETPYFMAVSTSLGSNVDDDYNKFINSFELK